MLGQGKGSHEEGVMKKAAHSQYTWDAASHNG